MSESFVSSGENSNIVSGPPPQLQGLSLPGIDNPQFVDGFGIVTPWGGGGTTRRYADYGITTDRQTQLNDLASAFIPAGGGGISFGLEGQQGIQGIPGPQGLPGIIAILGLNSSFLTELPHNIDLINQLGTASNKLIYTDGYDTYTEMIWVERQPAGDVDKDWYDVASDDDGSNLIAAVYFGRLYTSDDAGINWTERQPAGNTDKSWEEVASDSDGSNLIAAVWNGRLYTSADSGVSWTERRPAGDTFKSWKAVASDEVGSNLIVAVKNGRLYTSANSGVGWTERQPAGAVDKAWTTVASDEDGSNLIVAVSGGRLYTSADYGVNWTERRPAGDVDKNWEEVASDSDGSNLIVGVQGGRLYTSDDSGATWTERQPAGDTDEWWWGVASDSDGSNLIAAVNFGRLYTSDDYGVSWTEQQPAGDANKDWKTASSDLDGTNLIVAIQGGRLYIGTITVLYSEATWAESDLTSAGRALLDDTDAAAQATTIGVGTGDSPTWAGATLTNAAVISSDSVVFQPNADSTTFLQIKNAAGDPVVTIDTTNKQLDLIGSLELEDTTTSTTGVIYKDGDRFIHNFQHPDGGDAVPAGGNIFIGVNAGNFTMGNTATETYHGSFNNVIGQSSLSSNTTGHNNSAIGFASLFKNTSGSSNVAIGSKALQNNTTGYENMAIGTNALISNIGGGLNIAIGVNALQQNTSGIYNFGFGNAAVQFNSTGRHNFGIGTTALRYNQTGWNNIAIGSYAGLGVSGNSFSNNVLIGYEAGRSLSTGSDNVFLGYQSGYRQTALGNHLIIDNQDRGSAAAEITDCLIYGVFNATVTSQSLRFNVGELILASGTPYQTLWNTTHEDSDGGRESRLNFKGEQSGGEITTLARIEAGHDGTANDEKGYLDIFINSGSDGDSPTKLIRIDSDGLKIGDGGVTNYARFETDGTLVFNGTATTFNDIVISLSSARVPAANAPSWDSFIGNLNAYAYAVNDFQEFSTELSHSYKNGVTIEFHIHGAVNGTDGDDRTIKFEIEYSIADVQPESGFGDVYPATTTINAELTIPAATTDLTAFTIDIGDDTTGNFVQGAIVKGRIRRIASSGSEPSADPFLTEVGIHIESDTIGTRTATSK